nr:hypothetical protein [Tanacetum cinerariifolium]
LPPGVVAEPQFMEDHTVSPVDNNPFVNVFAPEPHSEAASSGDISSTESPYSVAFCLTEFCLKEVNSVKVGSKCHYLGSSPHTMTDVKAPPVRSNDQCRPHIRWV